MVLTRSWHGLDMVLNWRLFFRSLFVIRSADMIDVSKHNLECTKKVGLGHSWPLGINTMRLHNASMGQVCVDWCMLSNYTAGTCWIFIGSKQPQILLVNSQLLTTHYLYPFKQLNIRLKIIFPHNPWTSSFLRRVVDPSLATQYPSALDRLLSGQFIISANLITNNSRPTSSGYRKQVFWSASQV